MDLDIMNNNNKTCFEGYSKMKEYNTQLSLYFIENINMDKLKFLDNYFDECYEYYGKFKDPKTKQSLTDKRTIHTMIQKRCKSKNNEIRYLSRSKVGRISSSSWCLQNMNKICRHFLTDSDEPIPKCVDIDMENAHPNILFWISNIINAPTKQLERYILNREDCFMEYMDYHNCDRDNAKSGYLSLINDDSKLIRHDDPIYEFYNEIKLIQNKIWEFCMKEHPEIISKSKEKKYNIKGSCMANFLQTLENKMLQVMIEFVQSKGFSFIAPCHDGGLLPKDKVDEYGVEKLIEDLEFYIYDTLNIKIKLTTKPMNCSKELNEIYKKKKDEESLKELESLNLIPSISFEKKDVSNNYCYLNFWEGRRDTFESLNDVILYVKEYLPKVLILIHHNKGFFLKNEGSNEYTIDKYNAVPRNGLDNLNFYYKEIVRKRPEVLTIPLWKIIEMSKVQSYNSVVCRPNGFFDNGEFNIWIPFIADKKIKFDLTKIEPILDYIKTIVCNNDNKVYKWFFSWLRHICKYPETKTGVVPLLYSKNQRAGKGTFVNWLINCVFGRHCSYATNVSKLCKNFNGFLQGKVFVYIDELPTANGEYHNIFDNMKNLITDPLLDIEMKGIESYQTDNLLNFIASTNNKYSVKIEKGDGRWCVISVNEEKIGDRTFWDYHHKNVFTIDNGIHFFNYMIDIEDDDEMLVNVKNIPQTNLRQEIQDMCLSPPEMFLQLLKKRELDIDISIIGNTKVNEYGALVDPLISDLDIDAEYNITLKELYRVFDQWCDENNERKGKRKYIRDLIEQKEGRLTINDKGETKKLRYYTI